MIGAHLYYLLFPDYKIYCKDDDEGECEEET